MSNNYQQQDNASSDRMAEIRPDTHRSNPSERPITSLTRAASNTISSSSTTTAYYKNNFPQKLYRMLEYADTSPYDVQPIISWQPHGRSFMVKDKKRLQTEVLPLFFTTVHYDSFRRNLNHWGFHLINGVKNPDCGSYYHHLFLRTRLDLVNKIKRVKDKSCTPPVLNNTPSNASSSSSTRMPFYEPNFYEMEWLPQTQPQIPQGYVSTISNSRQSTNTSAATFAPFTTTDSVKPSSIWWDPRSSSNHLSSDSSRSFMAPPSMRSTSCTSSLYPSSDDMKMESEKASSTEAASSDNSSSDNQDMKTESEKASSTEAASSDNSSRHSDNQAPPSRMSTSCTSSSPSSDDMIIDKSQENKTKKVASMLLHDNVGDDVWDEEHWENFLTAQYHLLPSDLSELASVFDD